MAVILEEQTLEFSPNSSFGGLYHCNMSFTETSFEMGQTYTVVWDSEPYQCIATQMTLGEITGDAIGNGALLGVFEDTGEPFLFGYFPGDGSSAVVTSSTEATHTIAIYQGALEEDTPVEETTGISIILYDRTGAAVNYDNVETITTDTPDAEQGATFTYGVAVENAEYEPDFSNGNQKITLEKGQLMKEFTMVKPENLLPEYIKKNVEVAGIVGEFAGDEMEKTVELNMTAGDQVIEADADTVLTKVTVKKPETLLPENILKDVDIGGVVGIHDCVGYTIYDIATRTIDGEISDATLSQIGSYAFGGTSITKAAFPACANIGSYAFAGCVSLSDLELNYDEIGELHMGTFSGTNISEMNLPICSTLTPEVFRDCKKLTEVSLPKLSYLGGVQEGAFSGCNSLKRVVIPVDVSSFSSYAFYSCNNLSDIGEVTMMKVGDYAFGYCSMLSIINFGSGVCSVGKDAFRGCRNLEVVEGEVFLNGTSCNGFIDTFSDCIKLQSITIGINKPMLGQGAFKGCTALSKLTLCSDTVVFPIDSYFFDMTPFSKSMYLGKYGSIYIPSSLFYNFRSAEGWSAYSARMVSYTV